MNKILFFFLLICTPALFSQNQFGIGVIGAPAFYNIKLHPRSNDTAQSYSSDNGFSIGVDGNYFFKSNKLSFGLIFSTLTFDRTFLPITNTNVLDPDIPIFTTYQNTYLKIPLYYSRTLGDLGPLIFSFSVGLASNILLTS